MLHRFSDMALLAALVAVFVPACSPPRAEAEGWVGSIDTLPHGALWVSNPDRDVWDEDTRWVLTEELRIGSVGSQGPDQFGEIWAIAADSVGRIFVLDRQSKDVRVFHPDGRHLHTLGREGDGPGEFRRPWGMTWAPDGSLWVADVGSARYSVFDSVGAFVTSHPRAAAGFSWPWPGGFTRDSTLLEEDLGVEDTHVIGYRLKEDQLLATDTFPDPLGGAPVEDYDLFDLTDDEGLGAIIPVPFGRRWISTLDGVGGVWVGYNAEYRIAHQTLQGDTVMLIGRDAARVPVQLRERSEAMADLGEHREHPGVDPHRIPDTKPWFRALLPAPDGSLWVLREIQGPGWGFDVFDFRGRFLGTVQLPFEPALLPPPRVFDNTVLAVTRDELDAQYVVRLKVKRPRG